MVLIKERVSSPKGKVSFNDPEITLELFVYGAYTATQLENAVANYLDETYTVNGIVRFYDSYTYQAEGYGLWTVQAFYKKWPDSTEFNLTIGGGTRKVQKSLETIETYDIDGNLAPAFDGAINVTDKSVEGVDVPGRKLEFSLNKRFVRSSIPGSYIMDLYNQCCTVNDADFTLTYLGLVLTFAKGTLLFLDCQVKLTSEYVSDFTYKFRAERSLVESDDFRIGDSFVITKEGHHYLWFYTQEAEDATAGRVIRKPTAAYVERVFEYSDFSQIVL